MTCDTEIKYPKDLPKHHAVGRVFYGYDGQVYYCDSYDPRNDYWMTSVIDATDRKAVSPRAINGTFLSAWDTWKPSGPEEVEGRAFHMVDLRVSYDKFTSVVIDEKDCLALDERQILFFWPEDAVKFIKKVNEAAVKRAAAQALPSATSTVAQ